MSKLEQYLETKQQLVAAGFTPELAEQNAISIVFTDSENGRYCRNGHFVGGSNAIVVVNSGVFKKSKTITRCRACKNLDKSNYRMRLTASGYTSRCANGKHTLCKNICQCECHRKVNDATITS